MQNEFFKFWEDAAKNYQKAFESWQNLIPKWDTQHFQISQPFTEFLEHWFQGMSKMYMSTEEEKHKNQQMFGLFQDLEEKYLHVLSRMTAENMTKSYQKTFENASNIMQSAQNANPQIVLDYFQKIMTEYLKDIEEIPDNAKKIDIQKLWEIWGKIFSGNTDEDTQKYLQRFKETMRVKMQYGVEYYADPATTKVGLTPRNLVWKKGKYQLFHYPAKNSQNAAPLLIVYSLINKPYILDLLPGCSVIEYFTQNGLDVYLIEWGETSYGDKDITLDTLISLTLNEIVDFVTSYSKHPRVSMLGHCVGGVLALLYASLYPAKMEKLITLTTPITGTDGGMVGLWAQLLPTEQILQMFGNMPAKLIRYTFISLKPYYEVIRWKKFYENIDTMSDEALKGFYAVDKWLNDNIDVPGEIFRKFIREIYQEDSFKEGKTVIDGKVACLQNITCPLFNIIAEEDWIVTADSAKVLNELVASKENIQKVIPGQHLSIIFHPKNRPVWKEMLDFFLSKQKETTAQALQKR